MAVLLSPVAIRFGFGNSSHPQTQGPSNSNYTATTTSGRWWWGTRRPSNYRLQASTPDASSSASFDDDDYYSVLGLLPDATPEQIKKAYYNCMKSCHPDLSGNDPDTTNFCIFINEVYEVLSDPAQRMVYDEIHGYALTAINPFLDDTHPRDHVFVDEFSCIGCKNCANVCSEVFTIEEDFGRARACNQQGSPDLVQQAIDSCPVDCIHWTSAAQLSLLEDEMRRVERVNVALMLAGMGSSADVFRMASTRWDKRQNKLLFETLVVQDLNRTEWPSNSPSFASTNFVQSPQVRLHSRFIVTAIPRKKIADKASDGEEEDDSEKKTIRKRAPPKRRKKTESQVTEETPVTESNINNMDGETPLPSESAKPEKPRRRTRKTESVVTSTSSELNEEPVKKVTRRRRTKVKIEDTLLSEGSETKLSEIEDDTDNEKDLEFDASGGEDISFTYSWPPLICCFGPIQHAFVPSGRRANRLIDHESHERMKDALWAPEKFVRAPGGCAANVALCLARFGSNAAVMGKIGDDDFGQALLYYLNESRVQTRSVRIDPKRTTAVSRMKMSKRGSLRTTCVSPCAEDALRKTEINIDVLREAKMFYFTSFSLLDRKTKTSALQAINISKQFGGLIFFDLNLPLPLWHSLEETKLIIQEALELADIIEVTKQELEFLCGIEPSERFDTKDNDRSKFVHYSPDTISPILHNNLKVLFVTNGTSKVHYYTKEHNGSVLGMEDPPITPFTSDMSAAGDGLVAGLLSKLIVQPHLMTDKEYLVHSIDYAINCGVTEQWLQARTRGYPPKPGMEDDAFFPDPNGLKTITEKAFRTLFPVNDDEDSEELGVTINRHDDEDSEEDDVERHNDYESEEISDVELDDEEPIRTVNQSVCA